MAEADQSDASQPVPYADRESMESAPKSLRAETSPSKIAREAPEIDTRTWNAGRTPTTWLNRLARGCVSSLGVLLPPIGFVLRRMLKHLHEPRRLEHGYALILPGIEGRSLLNHGIAQGLNDAGYPGGIEIHDWTTGSTLMFAYHLRCWTRHEAQAKVVADKIRHYQAHYPGRPVHLIGHSGGAGILLLALGLLEPHERVTAGLLLAPAVSPHFNLVPALSHVERGLWNFWSPLDLLFLAFGTCLLGTLDGCHTVSAGARGFRVPAGLTEAEGSLYKNLLHEQGYHPKMALSFNLAGHFGCTNRVFAAEWLAPLLAVPEARGQKSEIRDQRSEVGKRED